MIKIYYLNIIINMRKEYEKRIKRKKNINLSKSSQPGKTEKNYVTIWMKLLLYTEKKSRNVTEIIAYLNYMYWKLCSQILHFPYTTSLKHRKQILSLHCFLHLLVDIWKTTVSFFQAHLFAKNPSLYPSWVPWDIAGYTYVVLVRWDAVVCSCSELRKSPGKFVAGQWSP